jgi:hypothetical protein
LRTFGVSWAILPMTAAQYSAAIAAHEAGKAEALAPRAHVNSLGIFGVERALGRQWLVAGASIASSEEAAFEAASAPRFDSGHELVLGPGLPAGFTPRAPSGGSGAGRVEELERTSLTTRLLVDHDRPQYLVVAATWYPGWRARIDGHPAELLRANYAFTALDVPAGVHEVVLEYSPVSWRIGLLCAGLGALAGTLLALRSILARAA